MVGENAVTQPTVIIDQIRVLNVEVAFSTKKILYSDAQMRSAIFKRSPVLFAMDISKFKQIAVIGQDSMAAQIIGQLIAGTQRM